MKVFKIIISFLVLTIQVFSADLYFSGSVDAGTPYNLTNPTTQAVTKNNTFDYYDITVLQDGDVQIDLLNTSSSNVVFTYSYDAVYVDPTLGTGGEGQSYTQSGATTNSHIYLVVYFDATSGSGTYDIQITLTPSSNQAPIANDKTYQVELNSTVIGNIITDSPADSDPDGDPISIDSNTTPSSGTLDLNVTDGNFTYNSSTSCGDYTFDYTLTDGSNTSTATITFDVQNILTPVDDFFVTAISTDLTTNVLTNDNNVLYSVSAVGSPSHGSITSWDSNGSFTYSPTAGYSGQDSFTYTITDGTCSEANATVTISVTNMCANAIPYTLCSGSISPEPTITAGTPQAYYFTLPADAVLDINLTNTGNKELQYDFQQANCGALFTSGTTSTLGQGDSVDIVKIYPADTYYIGFNVGQVSTTIDLSICFDTNTSGVGSFVNSSVGVNEIGVNYDTDKNITTKIVNKPFGLRTSYLNASGDVTTYDGSFGNNKNVDMSIILALADDDCNQPVPNEVIGQTSIADNTNHTDMEADAMTIDYAAQIRRIAITSFDFGNLFRAASGLQCANSSLSSSLCLVPACFNSIDNIRAVFPPAFYPRVNVCVNGDDPTKFAPCDSNAYTGNCGGKIGTISPPQYNTDLGCAQCLADAFEGEPCSVDNFAIRPKEFDVNITDGYTFTSGQDVNLKFEATDWNDVTPTTDYNELEDVSFEVDINVTDVTKNCPVKIELEGPVQFADGIDTGNFYFTDVGTDLNFTVREINGSEFAFVDADDTSDIDRFITPFERNINIIPDHFDIDANLTDHNTDSNFTYLHDINKYDLDDNYEMSTTLAIDIQAMGADNNITRNYMETCYAKDNNLTLGLSGTNITYPVTQAAPLTLFLYYNPVEDNGTVNSGEGNYSLPAPVSNTISLPSLPIENVAASFPADAPDGNGTTHIEYKLNFDRKQNLVADPFQIIINDVNITDEDGVTEDTVNIDENNATYYYARTRPSQSFYDDVTTSSKATPVAVDVYCGLGYTVCPDLGIDTLNAQITDANWWLSLGHDASTFEDGNVTLMVDTANITPSGTATIAPTNVTITSGGIENNVTVTATSANRPMTVPIELVHRVDTDTSSPGYGSTASPYTNHWLIYNKSSAFDVPSPFYKVRFIGVAGWAGHGDTGYVVDSNASFKKNRRLGW